MGLIQIERIEKDDFGWYVRVRVVKVLFLCRLHNARLSARRIGADAIDAWVPKALMSKMRKQAAAILRNRERREQKAES